MPQISSRTKLSLNLSTAFMVLAQHTPPSWMHDAIKNLWQRLMDHPFSEIADIFGYNIASVVTGIGAHPVVVPDMLFLIDFGYTSHVLCQMECRVSQSPKDIMAKVSTHLSMRMTCMGLRCIIWWTCVITS